MPCAAIANRTVSSLARKSSIRPTAVDPAGPRSRTWFAATAVVDGVAVAVGGVPALVSGSSVPRVKTNASTIADDHERGADEQRAAEAGGRLARGRGACRARRRRRRGVVVEPSSPSRGRVGRGGRPWRVVVARRRRACAPRRAAGRRRRRRPGTARARSCRSRAAASGPVGSAGTASPPGISRSGAATCAAQRCASGSARSSARVRSACACDCWPRSQSAISPDRAGAGRSGASAARPPRARVRIVSSGIPSRSDSSP